MRRIAVLLPRAGPSHAPQAGNPTCMVPGLIHAKVILTMALSTRGHTDNGALQHVGRVIPRQISHKNRLSIILKLFSADGNEMNPF